MRNTLLVYINSDEVPEKYIRYALNLARDLDLNAKFLYVFDPTDYPLGIPGTTGDRVLLNRRNVGLVTDNVKRGFEDLFQLMETEIPDHPPMDYYIEQGFPADVISHESEKHEARMIITEGSGNEDAFYLGETDMEIIRRTDRPVWVIPKNKDYEPMRNILYATDYQHEDIKTIKRLKYIAGVYSANLTVLHITDDLDFNEKIKSAGFQKMLVEKTGYRNIEVRLLADNQAKDVSKSIDDYAFVSGANLIVMLKENEGFLHRIFGKSTTGEMIGHTHIPVLVYHEPENE